MEMGPSGTFVCRQIERYRHGDQTLLMDGENNQRFIVNVIVIVKVVGKKMEKVEKVEKVEKYQDLSQELAKPWIIKLTVVPVVIGALGIVSGKLARHLKMTGVTIKIELLQKAVLLGTARFLIKVLMPEATGHRLPISCVRKCITPHRIKISLT